jgi:hypothetical protein
MTRNYAINYAIGIGGSGAKAIEALIHVCACGLGPNELTVAMMDPDDANGNQRRTLDAFESYKRARASLHRSGESKPSDTCHFLKTKLGANAAGLCWSPLPTGTNTMRDLFRYEMMNADEKTFFDAFYLEGDEQHMPLHEGFRGRPALGAAVLGALAHPDDEYWKELLDASTHSKQGGEVRLFVVGSVFGGTGAAGFPVISLMLRSHIRQQRVEGSVRLSGALFLPYFSYPPAAAGATGVAASPSVFLAKAQQALDYYKSLMRDDPVFDDLYLIGWPRLIPVAQRRDGGKAQCNPPMLPELYAAFAAADFFARPFPPRQPGGAVAKRVGRVFQMGIGDAARIEWSDVPSIWGDNPRSAREALGQALRTAYAYTRIYAPDLARDRLRGVSREKWYRLHVGLDRAIAASDREQEAVNALRAYCELMMRYLMTVSRDEAAAGMQVRLFENTGFVGGDPHPDDVLLPLVNGVSRAPHTRFATMVVGSEGRSLDQIRDGLSDARRAAQGDGLGRFVSSLHALCALGLTEAQQ